MPLQLYDNPASPFCRKVNVLLEELGESHLVERIPAIGHPTASEKMPTSINPLGKIPVLLRDDGPAIYDSRVICRFLDDHFGGRFYPAHRIWDVLTLEATADGMMDAAVLMVYESRARPEDKRHADWVEGQWAKIERGLDMLEDRWMSHLQGHFDIGVASVAIALDYLDFRAPERDWRDGRVVLGAWHAKIADRASLAQTMPKNP